MRFLDYSASQWKKTNKVLFASICSFAVGTLIGAVAITGGMVYNKHRADERAAVAGMAVFNNSIPALLAEEAKETAGQLRTMYAEKEITDESLVKMRDELSGYVNAALTQVPASDEVTTIILKNANTLIKRSENTVFLTVYGRANALLEAAQHIVRGYEASEFNQNRAKP